MSDCIPVYTVWRMAEDMFAAIGLGAIVVVVGLGGRWLVTKLLDAAAVDL